MSKKNRLPEIIIFAGPNGSGKTTITRMARTIGVYINADDIKRSSLCSDLEAAVKLGRKVTRATLDHQDLKAILKTQVQPVKLELQVLVVMRNPVGNYLLIRY